MRLPLQAKRVVDSAETVNEETDVQSDCQRKGHAAFVRPFDVVGDPRTNNSQTGGITWIQVNSHRVGYTMPVGETNKRKD